jgi:hypothetical protein
MSRKHKDRDEVFAILRFDAFHTLGMPPEVAVTVKEVVRTKETAEAEVARLNTLTEGREIRYWSQPTRLFPEGKSAGTE